MTDKTDMPRYLAAMKKLAGTVEPEKVVVKDALHDAWCAHWMGGACNCDPDVSAEDVSLHERES